MLLYRELCPNTGRLLADTLTDLHHAFLLSSQDSLFEIWWQEELPFAGLLGEICATASSSLKWVLWSAPPLRQLFWGY